MRRYGLLISSSTGDGLPNVDWVDHSLDLVLSMLTKSPGWAWDRLLILRAQDLQKDQSSRIESWLKAVDSGDLSFVYYTGHGRMVQTGNRQDLQLVLPHGGISARVVVDSAVFSKAANVFLALDCCFAEGAWNSVVSSFVEWMKHLFTPEQASNLKSMNRALYAACASNQFATHMQSEEGVKVGAFTYALVKGCQDGGGQGLPAAPAGTVTTELLANYLRTVNPASPQAVFGQPVQYGGFEIKSTHDWRDHTGVKEASRTHRGAMLPEDRTLRATPSWTTSYQSQSNDSEICTSHVAAPAYAVAIGYRQNSVYYVRFGRPFSHEPPKPDPTCTYVIPDIIPDDFGVKLSPDARHLVIRVRNNAQARTPTSLRLYMRAADSKAPECQYRYRDIDENIWADQFMIVPVQILDQAIREDVDEDSVAAQPPAMRELIWLITTEWLDTAALRRAGRLQIRTVTEEGPLQLVAHSPVGFGGSIHHMRFRSQANTSLLVTGDTNSHIVIWDLSTLQAALAGEVVEPILLTPTLDIVPPSVPDEPRYQIRRVATNPEGTLVAAGLADGTVYVWAISDGRLVAKLSMHRDLHKGPITALEFSPATRWLVSAGERSVFLTDLSSLDQPNAHRWLGPNDLGAGVAVRSLAFSNNRDHQIVTAGASNGQVFLTHDIGLPTVGSMLLPGGDSRREIYRLAILPCNMHMYRLIVVDRYRVETWYLNWEDP